MKKIHFTHISVLLALCVLFSYGCDKEEEATYTTTDPDTSETIIQLATDKEAPFLFAGMSGRIGNGLEKDWCYVLVSERGDTTLVSGTAYEMPEGTHISFTLPEGVTCERTYHVPYAFNIEQGVGYALGYHFYLDAAGNVILRDSYDASVGFFGNGTEEAPYLISTLEHLVQVSTAMIEQKATFEGVYFALAGDINCDDTHLHGGSISNYEINNRNGGMRPIGFDAMKGEGHPFCGVLDGRGHAIIGFRLTPSGEQGYAALFYHLGGTGMLRNMRMDRVSVNRVTTSLEATAGLVGLMDGDAVIAHCAVSGKLTGYNNVGGMVGLMRGGQISYSEVNVDVVSAGQGAGGFVGTVELDARSIYLTDLHMEGTVSGNYEAAATSGNYGGIAGYAKGGPDAKLHFERDSCEGNISGRTNIGGMLGGSLVPTIFANCYVSDIGTVSGQSAVGGLLGMGQTDLATFRNCRIESANTDNTQTGISASGSYVGGLSGWLSVKSLTAESNYIDRSNIRGTAERVGGLFGYIGLSSDLMCQGNTLRDVDLSGKAEVGGLIGRLEELDHAQQPAATIQGKTVITGAVHAGGNHVGGVIGYANLSQISLQGDVLAKASVAGAQYVGGYVGSSWSGRLLLKDIQMTDSNAPAVKATKSHVGGLCGWVCDQGLTVKDCVLTRQVGSDLGVSYTGGFVAEADRCTITGSEFSGKLSGKENSGGFIGKSTRATIKQSLNKATITAENTQSVGGAIGYAKDGVLEQVTNQGTLQASGSTHVGGITGYGYGNSLTDCVNEGTITGQTNTGGMSGLSFLQSMERTTNKGDITGSENTGGIAGFMSGGSLHYAANRGAVTGSHNTGGIAGKMNSTNGDDPDKGHNLRPWILYSYNLGKIDGDEAVGGIAGSFEYWSLATVENSYNRAQVGHSGSKYCAGIVGEVHNTAQGHIANCYSGGIERTGWGLVGRSLTDADVEVEVRRCYYCKESAPDDKHNSTHYHRLGSNDFTQANLSGWDFDKVWIIRDSWPELRDNPEVR